MTSEWVFERSSGYDGYRNTQTGEWVYESDYKKKQIEQDMIANNIFEGFDHFNQIPLYRVDFGDYIGEWHTDREIAIQELKNLVS